MNQFKNLLLTLLCILFFIPHQLKSEDIIKISVGNWPPYFSENMSNKGLAAQIISEVFEKSNYKTEFYFYSWSRAYNLAKKGEYDATGIWLKKQERFADFDYSDSVIQEEHVFFYRKSDIFSWKHISDLKGKKIGGLVKFSYGDKMDRAIESGDLNIYRVGTDVQNFKKLLVNRIDIYPQEINVAYHILKSEFTKEEREKISHDPKPFMNDQSYLLFSKNIQRNKELIKSFNSGLKALKASGRYDEILNGYKYEQ